LWLKGKSKCCSKKISLIYPFVEALTASLFLASFLRFGWSFTCLEMCVFLTLAVPCFFIDLEHYLLPDILTFPGMGLALLGSFYSDGRTFLSSLLGLVLGGGFFWLLSWLYEKTRKKEGMGFGDVKLMAWLGALGGLSSLGFIIFASSFLGAFVGIFVIVFLKGTKDTALPFGPFLILSALAYYFFSEQVTHIFGSFIV
jgi:leader peptidase (prepilin peptidase)/N-methyltransferase